MKLINKEVRIGEKGKFYIVTKGGNRSLKMLD